MGSNPICSSKNNMRKATELEFLRWFYQNADFGPMADARYLLIERFKKEKKKDVPKKYEEK